MAPWPGGEKVTNCKSSRTEALSEQCSISREYCDIVAVCPLTSDGIDMKTSIRAKRAQRRAKRARDVRGSFRRVLAQSLPRRRVLQDTAAVETLQALSLPDGLTFVKSKKRRKVMAEEKMRS